MNFLEKVAMIWWRLWRARNELIFENRYILALDIVNPAISVLQELQTIRPNEAQRTGITSKWQQLTDGQIKVNVDVVVNKHQVGIGAMARDNQGKILFALAQSLPKCSSVVAMEAQVVI